jgi:hypothetical protein
LIQQAQKDAFARLGAVFNGRFTNQKRLILRHPFQVETHKRVYRRSNPTLTAAHLTPAALS